MTSRRLTEVTTFTDIGDNHLVTRTIGGATITYAYDGNGTAVNKSPTDGTSIIYIGGINGRRLAPAQ